MNSYDNSFTAYSALRRATLEPQEAWDSLGRYGGDDGVTPDPTDEIIPSGPVTPFIDVYTKVATDMGLKLKATSQKTSEPLTFLGRTYLAPKYDNHNMCDIVRTVPKLGVTNTGRHIPPDVALYNKARGLYTSDAHTPFVGCYARNVLRILKLKDTNKKYDCSADEPYNKHIAVDLPPLAYEMAAELLGVSESELRYYESRLDAAKTLEDLELGLIFSTLERPKADGMYFRQLQTGESFNVNTYEHTTPTRVTTVAPPQTLRTDTSSAGVSGVSTAKMGGRRSILRRGGEPGVNTAQLATVQKQRSVTIKPPTGTAVRFAGHQVPDQCIVTAEYDPNCNYTGIIELPDEPPVSTSQSDGDRSGVGRRAKRAIAPSNKL